MLQLFQVEVTQTATFGGGGGLAVVSPFRVVSTSRASMTPLGLPFSSGAPDERALRYSAGCERPMASGSLQEEVADATYARLLAGEVVQTMSGKVQILPAPGGEV